MANGTNPKLHKDLLLACGWGKEIDVVLLLQQGASVKVQDQNGRNCLHYAASKGHTNIVEILLLKKCNANAKDKFGSTPLHQAAVNGHTECAATLIEGGADVSCQDENGNTPLFEAVWNNQFETSDLFLNSESDVNIKNQEGFTPLHLACQNNNARIIQDLIKWGANIQSQIRNGNTPLHIAVQNSHIEAVKVLLSLEADVNFQNHDGDSPLHICAETGEKRIARALLESGQPYEASLNNVGDSAKDIAIQLGNKEVAEIIPTPMLARKASKKIESKNPGSPKRAHKHKASSRSRSEVKPQKKSQEEQTDSLERPLRVVIQPASFDNLLASDTCSSLSSLWLPVPESGSPLPMDAYWQKGSSPARERKGLAAVKELGKADVLSHSDGSVVKHPKHHSKKKRRKNVSNQQMDEEDWVDEELMKDSKKVAAVKSPNFKKKRHGSVKKIHAKKLKKVLEQGEEELSIASPTEHRKNVVITEALISSPRVKGRAELKTESVEQPKRSPHHNGSIPAEEKHAKEQKSHKKGLKEYFIDTLNSRRSPAGTDGSGSWTLGTLEPKKKKDPRKGDVDLHQHMKLTEKDIEALIKSDSLERTKKGKEKKKTIKANKNIYADSSEGEQEIVVIRLDPSLETPKKSRKVKSKEERKAERKEDKKHDRSFDKTVADGKKIAKVKPTAQASPDKKERKVESKEWPKFEVNKHKTCEAEPATNGRVPTEQVVESYGTLDRPQRHRHHKSRTETPTFSPTPPTLSPVPPAVPPAVPHHTKKLIFDNIHKLEKRFKQFLTLTAEKLEEQKDSDSKHYNTLKNDISCIEKNLQRTTRENAVEIVQSLTKELNTTMRKWTNILRQNTPGAAAEKGVCSQEGGKTQQGGAKQIGDTAQEICTAQEGGCVPDGGCTGETEKTPQGGQVTNSNSSSDTSRSSGFDIIQSYERVGETERAKQERAGAENTWEPVREFPDHEQPRAAPLGRSDESSPGPQSRHSGDGDHMSLEKWYEQQLKEAERKWQLKSTAEQQSLKNRIKDLEDELFKYTGHHSTMV